MSNFINVEEKPCPKCNGNGKSYNFEEKRKTTCNCCSGRGKKFILKEGIVKNDKK